MSIENPKYVTIKLHGGSGYTMGRTSKDLGDAVLGELDGMQAGERIILTLTMVDMSDEQYANLGDFEGH